MIRVRVSTLESFRRVIETAYGDESALIRSVMGKPDPPTPIMEAGTAFHELLAAPSLTGYECSEEQYLCRGYIFDARAVAGAKEHQGPGLREVTARKVYDLGGLAVEVQGTADHVRGLFIRDAKTKFSPADPKDYEPSLQFRFYLDLHDAAAFTYDLFSFADPKDGFCALRDVVSFRFWRYPGLAGECSAWTWRFVEGLHDKRLAHHLESDPMQKAGAA